jgi:D-alanyl-lipoteichoic acid acyltransferase DltB (MBOAT superfamily)
MVFNSVVFLFCFLPLSLLLYYLVPGRAKNAVLLAESLIFYCWTSVAFLPLIAVLIVFNYLWALLTARAKAKLRGLLPLAAVLVNLGVLVYFKYANFLIDTVNQVAHLGLAALNIGTVLPLGISYYIFKIISYEVDVCTGKIAPEKNFITFAVYVLFFPQLIVGPIVKYREMADQLHDGANRCTPARAEHGAELFVFGLAKKVILADSIGALWTDIIGAGGVGLTNVSTPLAWLGIIAYSLQLYFDFAGYSEMSNGLAALLGFDCPANFNLPYISGSITEFWRRWHITLSGWFRDYIYIPLGGNRKGQVRQLLNMFLVWAATGIWHGASWNFIAWGLYYFVLLTIEKNFLLKYLKKGKVWPHIYTLFFVVLGWGIFTANQPGAPLGLLLQKLFVPQGGISPVYYLRNYGVLLVLGCVCSSALPHWLWEKISKNTVAKLLVFALLTALCVCYVVAATNATALYANF